MEVFEPPLLQETAFSARPIPKLGMSQEDDPQYEIKSDKTDHVAAHKGSALTLLDD